MRRALRVDICVVVGLVAAMGGACAPPPPAPGVLAPFGGGFDPLRFQPGPLPPLDDAARATPVRFAVPRFYGDGYGGALAVGGVDARVGGLDRRRVGGNAPPGSSEALEAILEERTGLDFVIRARADERYSTVADALLRGELDVAELSPYAYVLLEQGRATPDGAQERAPGEAAPIVPLAATVAYGASTYGSYLVVSDTSPLHGDGGADALRGKRIAFVDPVSTSGYLLPAHWLRAQGIDLERDVTVVYSGSHAAAIMALLAGEVDVAAVSSDLLIGSAGLAGPLRIIAKCGRVPYDVIVARADLPAAVRARIEVALWSLSIHDEAGRKALRTFSAVDAFMPVPVGHYDGVRALAAQRTASP